MRGVVRRIVVADDNPGLTSALQVFLGRCGWEVTTAGNGLEALELVRTVRPAAVLIDIRLPKLDGLEVARRIRAEGIACHLVAMSGFGTADDRDRSRQAGFAVHLVKPIPPTVLSAALEAAMADPAPDRGGG
jgi:CheY-like chemotaxis protein